MNNFEDVQMIMNTCRVMELMKLNGLLAKQFW